ncbi:hypothetical protein GCM10027258_14520 [Amycolatopsis stemonae]
MSSTADTRRSAPARPALTAGEPRPESGGLAHARGRTPRPWTAALQRPAAKILVAGGLTLAGWLLTGALSGSTAAAAEHRSCPEAPAVSTVDQAAPDHAAKDQVAKLFAHGKHRTAHREAVACARQPEAADETAKQPEDTQAAETPPETAPETKIAAKQPQVESTKDTQTSEAPSVKTTPKASANLLGGLVGGVVDVVGGTLNTVTTTLQGTLNTVGALTDTLSHTVLAPLTQPPANNPGAAPLLPIDDILNPIFTGASNSGGVTVTVPGAVTATVTQVAAPVVTESAATEAAAATTPQTTHVAVVHLVERQDTLPARPEQPRDSGVHARNGGGDSTPGLPGGTGAPSAPAPSAAPGHDGPGGARHPFAVHTDDVTTTQLKLIGTSRDHEVDGAGREAALPTTSPD